jgi:hypothetical protein
VISGSEVGIDRIDARRLDLDQHLTGPGLGNGHVIDFHDLRRTVFMDDD